MTGVREQLEEELNWNSLDTRGKLIAVNRLTDKYHENAIAYLRGAFQYSEDYYDTLDTLGKMVEELDPPEGDESLEGLLNLLKENVEGYKNMAGLVLGGK